MPVIAFQDLPLASRDRGWDAAGAKQRVQRWASSDGSGDMDKIDWPKLRKAYVWYDSAAAETQGGYKLIFSDVIDGTLTAIPRGVFAVAGVLQGARGGVDIPESDMAGAKAHIARHYVKMRKQFDDESIVAPWEESGSKTLAGGDWRQRLEVGVCLQRTFHLGRALRSTAIDLQARTVELAFSSETPVERWDGMEVLSHKAGACRLDRLNHGGAVLVNHDCDDQVGVVEEARIDSDRVGRAVVRFSQGEQGSEIFQDVVDGIRQLVSVSYLIHAMELTSKGGGEPDTYTVTDWEPLEISIVSVPADASVGVGRSTPNGPGGHATMKLRDLLIRAVKKAHDGALPDGLDVLDDEALLEAYRAAVPAEEAQRTLGKGAAAPDLERDVDEPAPTGNARQLSEADARTMRDLGERFGLKQDAEELIELGGTLEDMRQRCRNHVLNRRPEPVPSARDVIIQGGAPVHGKLNAFEDNEQGRRNAYVSGMWCRGILFRGTPYHDREADAWCRANMRAMASGVFSQGGVLIPDEMGNQIINLREKYGAARRLCDVWPMTTDTLTVPRWTGDVTAYFEGESETANESDPTFDGVKLVARKLGAMTRIPEELLEDSSLIIPLADRVTMNMAWAFAKKEDQCFIDGDGTSTYGGIVGLRTKIVDGTHTAGAVDAATGHNLLTEMDGDDLDPVRAALPEYAEQTGNGPQWLAHKTAKNLIFDAIVRAAGGNTMDMLGGRPTPAYLGDEIVVSQAMPGGKATDYVNTAMLFYGNFRMGASLGSRREFRVKTSVERYFDQDQIALRATERFDINVHSLGDTSTAGPIVALIGA